jgi:hypothetical protein
VVKGGKANDAQEKIEKRPNRTYNNNAIVRFDDLYDHEN